MHGEFLKPVRPATAFSACARKHRWRRAPGTSVSVTQSLPLSREITITAGQWSAADKYSALCLSVESQTRAQRAADVTDRDRERDAWPQSRVRSAERENRLEEPAARHPEEQSITVQPSESSELQTTLVCVINTMYKPAMTKAKTWSLWFTLPSCCKTPDQHVRPSTDGVDLNRRQTLVVKKCMILSATSA